MEKIINPVIGEEVTFIKTSRQSNGEVSLLEVLIRPKASIPLHYHKRFSETFKVIDGELSIQVDKKKMKLLPGQEATAPCNSIHRFYNETDKPVRFTVELRPGSEGFENVLRIGFGLARDGQAGSNGMPKSLMHNGILMKIGEGSFVGFFSILEKFFLLFAKSEKAQQVEKELLNKYCEIKTQATAPY
jgi:mannose-6-phosphate isomerase-like protein (cupin superfamily)